MKNRNNVILLLVFAVVLLISSVSTSIYMSDYEYYRSAHERAVEDLNNLNTKPVTKELVAGRDRLDNPNSFNNMFATGSFTARDGLHAGALALYNNTGIQLYYMDFDFGKKVFETEAEIQAEVVAEIKALPNVEYSIVFYDYNTDYDWDEPYYYASYDNYYYGDKVASYLSSSDLQMLNYYESNKYDLWEYSTREAEMWKSVGENIANGYNAAEFAGKPVTRDSLLWDIQFYKECKNSSLIGAIIFGFLFFVSIYMIFVSVKNIRKVIKHEERRQQADIEYKEAMATKAILEANITEVSDLADEYLKES